MPQLACGKADASTYVEAFLYTGRLKARGTALGIHDCKCGAVLFSSAPDVYRSLFPHSGVYDLVQGVL